MFGFGRTVTRVSHRAEGILLCRVTRETSAFSLRVGTVTNQIDDHWYSLMIET